MYKQSLKLLLILPLFVLITFASPVQAHAFSFGDIFNSVKSFFSPDHEDLVLTPNITLAPNGDLNKNGKIDSGDTVNFSYTITNPTKNLYAFTTLKTNVPVNEINSISNLKGATSIDQEKNGINFTHLTIQPLQVKTISFDAKVDYFTKQDQTIGTNPVLFDSKNKTIASSEEDSVVAAKMDSKLFNKFTHISK